MRKYRRLFFTLFLLLFLFYMLFEPAKTLEGSRNGLLLWFQTLLPTLLPFLILSNLLLNTQMIPRLLRPLQPLFHRGFGLDVYGGYAFITGLFCGYPMGAKVTADLYETGQIPRAEADYLLAICNNPSPAFLITYVIHENLNTVQNTGQILLLFYGSLFLSTLVFRLNRHIHTPALQASSITYKKETPHPLSPGELIDVSIMNGFETITKLGGYIILCSIAVTALNLIPEVFSPIRLLLSTTIEISTGIHTISLLPFPYHTKLLWSLCASAFGGCCILLQTYSVIRKSGLSLRPYLSGKLTQTIITAVIFLIF